MTVVIIEGGRQYFSFPLSGGGGAYSVNDKNRNEANHLWA